MSVSSSSLVPTSSLLVQGRGKSSSSLVPVYRDEETDELVQDQTHVKIKDDLVPGAPVPVVPPLSARQRAIVAYIRTHVAAHGYPPTVRDIATAVGLVSPSSVAYQLGELTRLGAIRRDPDRPRALAVVDPQACPTCGRGGGG